MFPFLLFFEAKPAMVSFDLPRFLRTLGCWAFCPVASRINAEAPRTTTRLARRITMHPSRTMIMNMSTMNNCIDISIYYRCINIDISIDINDW